jgi:hypothetical protein
MNIYRYIKSLKFIKYGINGAVVVWADCLPFVQNLLPDNGTFIDILFIYSLQGRFQFFIH